MDHLKLIIDKVVGFIFSVKTIYALLFVGVLLFLISMWNRYPHIDDMWYGEQAFFLAHDGVVKLETMDGILNFSKRMFVYHKLHVIAGAIVTYIFGWSVFPFKYLTLTIYIGAFATLYSYHKKNEQKLPWLVFLLASTLIFLNPNAFLYAFMFRPDIMVMTLGFLTFYFIDRFLLEGENKWIFCSGICAGLAFFTHLNGIIFPVAGFLLLSYFKRYKALPFFFFSSAIVASLYFFDLWQEGHWEAMIYEFKNYPLLKFGSRQLTGLKGFMLIRITSFLEEIKRFFWSDHVYAFSILFFIAVIFNFKYLYNHFRSLLVYVTLIIIGMGLLVFTKSPHYLLYYYPYMAIITAIGIIRSIEQKKRFLMVVYAAGFVLQFYHLHYQFLKIFNRNGDFVEKHRRALSHIPDQNARIMVPYEYIYNTLTEYDLINFSGISYYQADLGHDMSQGEFFKRAIDLNVKYIVLDKEFYENEKVWMPNNLLKENDWYKKILEKEDFYLLEVIE